VDVVLGATQEDHVQKTKIVAMTGALALFGCGLDMSDPYAGGADAAPGTSVMGPTGSQALIDGLDTRDVQGNLRLYLTDAPVEFDEVWVTISSIAIARDADDDAEWLMLAQEPQRFDLLTLQDDVTAILADAALDPGAYAQMRLVVDEAAVVIGDEVEPLFIPSGEETGIKLNLDFYVEAGKSYAIVLDFDARESIMSTGNGRLMMAPVITVEHVGELPSEDEDEGEGDEGGDADDDGEEEGDGDSEDEPSEPDADVD
jgi:hypothetical protein